MTALKSTASAMVFALGFLGACRTHPPREASPSASRPPSESTAAPDASRVPRLTSVRAAAAPTLDGVLDEAAWETTETLDVVARRRLSDESGPGVTVSLRSVHTATHIYFAATWQDSTESISHKSWAWNAASGRYEEGSDREDMLALAFELSGPFTGDMLSPVDAVWDVWHWKAFRTNPHGYAMDKTHRYSRTAPSGKANLHLARDGSTVWIARPEDSGDTVERKRPAPTSHEADRVPQYAAGTPTGSAADVRAKGLWRDGRWSLELERRLDTGHPDDTPFAPGRTIRMAVSTHDQTGGMDRASDTFELVLATVGAAAGALAPPPGAAAGRAWSFDSDREGGAPPGFSFGRTGSGPLGRWTVRAEADAPSRPNVLAQLDADDTDFRFPVVVADAPSLQDLRLSVRCKMVSGRVDQAGGLVFRYGDANNYYITRANALEDNIRLYCVKDGRRKQIGSWSGEVSNGEWHELRVEARGDRLRVFWDGAKVIDVRDRTFAEAGKVGVWTKADSVTYFDNLNAAPLARGSP